MLRTRWMEASLGRIPGGGCLGGGRKKKEEGKETEEKKMPQGTLGHGISEMRMIVPRYST